MKWNSVGRSRLSSAIGVGLLCLATASESASAGPAWWGARGVVDPLQTADDYAIVNLGQLKWMATQAAEEFNSFLPGGASPAVLLMINTWSTLQPNGTRIPIVTDADDYAIVNLGQLKSTAVLFYDQLRAAHVPVSNPWVGTADDYAAANLGQLKTVFNFTRDLDNDGLDDWWEARFYPDNLTQLGAVGHDQDGDGRSDLAEFQANTNPSDPAPTLTIIAPIGATLQ